MSENTPPQPFTEEERKANSRVDAMAILAIVLIVVGMVTYFVSL